MPADMLVKLYDLKEKRELYENLKKQGISIKRAMPADESRVVQFVKNNFGGGWAHDCSYAFSNHPVSCYVAVREKKPIGFACYDSAAKNFLTPVGVYEKFRGMGIGEALLRACLEAMRGEGYGYAVVGWVEDNTAGFFENTVGAAAIAGSFPGVYRNLIAVEE
ncbi:MAG: GNAT family N-acetyltransferase [Oscillospiraceae bacterium]|jgi:ribosomal protein S18 acetylase RimI-like enzyme|nr:GNAT family N-acetyltransferase [Oscillospiraceae bacterium]MCI1989775.1 GNAT family N-acetyltransferase [Oscillospiraceae bacterium]MCI2034378.1 GNAT family N-acetyltransferase [Oscillospiraceae bacterium]